ncbi:MAG: anthranilate 1,2-dioxygenase [Pseudomonadales bacterium]|nr:anthranilate 1,2-dioxygenase [Pseudomonadales bacterium]
MNDDHTGLELERRVMALHRRYIRVIDDDRLEEWPGLFSEDGLYKIVTRENYSQNLPLALMSCEGRGMMQDRVTGFRRINVYESQRYSHQGSGLEILRADDRVVECISNYLVVRTMIHGAMSIFSAGVYQDQILLDAHADKFLERIVIPDSRQIDTLLVIPL